MNLIARLVLALVAAVVAWLICLLIGAILTTLVFPLAVVIGHFLEQWAFVIAVLVFLYYFFVGYASGPWVGRFGNRP